MNRSAERYLPYGGPPGSWHAAVSVVRRSLPISRGRYREIGRLRQTTVSARSMLHLRSMKIGKRYSLDQSPKIAAHAVEWRRVLSLARSFREAGSVCENEKEARSEAAHAHLHDVNNKARCDD